MDIKTEARLVYGGLLVFLLLFARIAGGWYGLFDRHSPDRALAAEIEKTSDLRVDITFVERSNDNDTVTVHALINDTTLTPEEFERITKLYSPAVFYSYVAMPLNSSEDGSKIFGLFSIGFLYCESARSDCEFFRIGQYVSSPQIEGWWFGYEKGSQLWVKSDRNILVILEKLFKPEASASE